MYWLRLQCDFSFNPGKLGVAITPCWINLANCPTLWKRAHNNAYTLHVALSLPPDHLISWSITASCLKVHVVYSSLICSCSLKNKPYRMNDVSLSSVPSGENWYHRVKSKWLSQFFSFFFLSSHFKNFQKDSAMWLFWVIDSVFNHLHHE